MTIHHWDQGSPWVDSWITQIHFLMGPSWLRSESESDPWELIGATCKCCFYHILHLVPMDLLQSRYPLLPDWARGTPRVHVSDRSPRAMASCSRIMLQVTHKAVNKSGSPREICPSHPWKRSEDFDCTDLCIFGSQSPWIRVWRVKSWVICLFAYAKIVLIAFQALAGSHHCRCKVYVVPPI